MAEHSNAAPDIRAPRALRSDALTYWEYQERAPLGDPPEERPDDTMASGWWILPVLVLSVPAWVALLVMIF